MSEEPILETTTGIYGSYTKKSVDKLVAYLRNTSAEQQPVSVEDRLPEKTCLVSESIFSDGHTVIPMADVQHVEKKYHDVDLVDGTKAGDLLGGIVVTKHTKWDIETDFWANNIWLDAKQTRSFLKAWCYYRYELEKETLEPPPPQTK